MAGRCSTITERIDEVLHATPNGATNAYGIIWACVAEQPFRMPEIANGRNFRHSGSSFESTPPKRHNIACAQCRQ